MPWPEHLDEVATSTRDRFDPREWHPIYPNSAFANLTTRDAYWAAKIVSAFTDDDIRVMVEQGRYQDPRAVDWLVTHLGRRRDIIARTWFDAIAPLDFWVWEGRWPPWGVTWGTSVVSIRIRSRVPRSPPARGPRPPRRRRLVALAAAHRAATAAAGRVRRA